MIAIYSQVMHGLLSRDGVYAVADVDAALARVFGVGVRPLRLEQALFDAMLSGWRSQQAARYIKAKTIAANESGVRRFAEHVGCWPWEWRSSHVDEYFEDLLARPQRLARSTLRAYQFRLKGFSDYVCDRRYPWSVISEREFGRGPGQLFDGRNLVAHLDEFEGDPRRRPLTVDELELFFAACEARMEACRARGRKGSLQAWRDQALFKVAFAWGLRRAEVAMLDTVDFRPHPKLAEFGGYGQLHVRWGKAKRGGGPQRRTVLTVFDWAPEIVDQYVQEIRPAFGCPKHPGLFLTERGTRISVQYVSERFAEIRAEAGLDDMLTPHCLRHSYVTHLAELGWASKFIQDQVGHSHAATTAIYMSVSDDFKDRMVRGKEGPCNHADSDRPVCLACAPRRLGACGVCGRMSRIACRATGSLLQVGICCYKLPNAVCTDCGRERPCYWAKADEPVCASCTAVRRAEVCVGCGERRVAQRRVDGGILCQTCDVKHGYTTGMCHGCGQTAPLTSGVCAACKLRTRVDQLAAGADSEVAATLSPFLGELARSKSPRSTLRWFYTPGFEITRQLLAGEIPISHRGLDRAAVDAPNPVAFVRAKLVDSGVLDPRDEASAQFAAWHATAVLRIAPGPDRGHVRAYATWRVAHQLARTVQRRGEATRSSIKYARSLVSEAIALVLWLHDQHIELAGLRQDLIDLWIAGGSGMRRRVRLFLAWLRRASVTSTLDVDWDDRLPTRPAIDDERRFAILRRLLHDPELDSRDRFAGSVLLLYGKPITRIAALTTTDIHTALDGEITLRLGRGEIPLPEPLDAIAKALRDQQLERTGSDGWLIPGRHAGQHITADTLLLRLKRHGIDRSREGRHAALLALAARLPAPILAERIGIHQSRAAAWVRMAGSTYADYVSLPNRDCSIESLSQEKPSSE